MSNELDKYIDKIVPHVIYWVKITGGNSEEKYKFLINYQKWYNSKYGEHKTNMKSLQNDRLECISDEFNYLLCCDNWYLGLSTVIPFKHHYENYKFWNSLYSIDLNNQMMNRVFNELYEFIIKYQIWNTFKITLEIIDKSVTIFKKDRELLWDLIKS